jgi:hypothetical protein
MTGSASIVAAILAATVPIAVEFAYEWRHPARLENQQYLYYICDNKLSYEGAMSETKTETITFRIASTLKDEFAAIAEGQAKPVGELLRELVRERVKQKKRREFEAEARRQSLECAAVTVNPDSDEAQVMRELDANFDEFARGLAAREEAAARKWK